MLSAVSPSSPNPVTSESISKFSQSVFYAAIQKLTLKASVRVDDHRMPDQRRLVISTL